MDYEVWVYDERTDGRMEGWIHNRRVNGKKDEGSLDAWKNECLKYYHHLCHAVSIGGLVRH